MRRAFARASDPRDHLIGQQFWQDAIILARELLLRCAVFASSRSAVPNVAPPRWEARAQGQLHPNVQNARPATRSAEHGLGGSDCGTVCGVHVMTWVFERDWLPKCTKCWTAWLDGQASA